MSTLPRDDFESLLQMVHSSNGADGDKPQRRFEPVKPQGNKRLETNAARNNSGRTRTASPTRETGLTER